ncbi:MAG: anthranilate synthase component I, partial [Lachnospiraceae bacterium]|nr:anthranilate synthase component I [Lachnospiraceae bacterium]
MTLEQARAISQGYKVVPISREVLSDMKTPMEVLRILKGVSKHCYMLESVENQEVWGRYTFLGYDPKLEITCTDGTMTIRESGEDEGVTKQVQHPGECIKEILQDYTSPKVPDMPSFTGGLVGYFSYDYVKYSEPKLKLDAADEEGFKDVDLMLFDKVIVFDNLKQKIVIIANAQVDHLDEEYDRCQKEIQEIIDLIQNGTPAYIEPGQITSEFRPLFSEKEYCEMVEKAK